MPLRHLVVLAFIASALCAEPSFEAAQTLLHEKRYPEAREALERIVSREPENAAAWHELGRVWRARGDERAIESAVNCLARAVELEPRNSVFLTDYGTTALQLSSRTRSMSAATRGRQALERVVDAHPEQLDAREALYQYYSRAPFFGGGNSSKAATQLAEIRHRDPDRGLALAVASRVNATEYAAAFGLCEEVLAKEPANYTALYQCGRTAAISGERLDRGLQCLQTALGITPPTAAYPGHIVLWCRIGSIQEELGHAAEAKAAYESALKLDPTHSEAQAALSRLGKG